MNVLKKTGSLYSTTNGSPELAGNSFGRKRFSAVFCVPRADGLARELPPGASDSDLDRKMVF